MTVPMKLRFPVELRRQIEEAASANKRSLNAEITARLESSFRSESSLPFLSKAAAKAAMAREDAAESDVLARLDDLERRMKAVEKACKK